MPAEQVDNASLAPDRVGHLGLGDPRRQAGEHTRHCLVHGRVTGIDQPTEVAAVPPDYQVDPGIQCIGHQLDGSHRHVVQGTAFDPADGLSRHTGPDREIDLPPRSALPNTTEHESHLVWIHEPMIEEAAQPVISTRPV